MLASETEEIASIIRDAMASKYGLLALHQHFANTKDTLCYATNENQTATIAMIDQGADLAIVVGGYNSSNTSHLVELCSSRLPTYYVKDSSEILSQQDICSYDLNTRSAGLVSNWLKPTPEDRPVRIALTCGASCPDRTVEEVLIKIVSLFPEALPISYVLKDFFCPKVNSDSKSLLLRKGSPKLAIGIT
jgi:4-hydroxy-3-methylbut-2-enyl diphosphate reductase